MVVGVVTVALGWSASLMLTDLRQLRLPDRLTLPAAAVVWLALGCSGHHRALAGAVAWWALCAVPGLFSARLRIGGGDAKLALTLGAVTAAAGGVVGWWTAVAGSSLLTLALAPVCAARATERTGRTGTAERTGTAGRAGDPGTDGSPAGPGRPRVPHGPGMLVASWLSVLLTV